MKIFFKVHWKEIAFTVFVTAIGLLIYFPSLKLNFSLLDDGLTILNAKIFLSSLVHLNAIGLYGVLFEPLNGRVRLVYWIIQYIFSWISFYNSHIFHLLRLLLLAVTLFLSFKIMARLRIWHSIILFSILIYLMNIQNFENYYRLGPVEPLLVFILVVLYYLIFFSGNKIRIWIAEIGTLTIMGGFIKENFFLTGFALIPSLILAKLGKKNEIFRNLLWLLVFSVLAGILVFLVRFTYPSAGIYTSNYVLDLKVIINNFWAYVKMIRFAQTPFFEISIIYLTIYTTTIFRKKVKRMSVEDLFFLSLWLEVLIQLVVLAPWKFVLNRYLTLVNVNLIFIYAITLNNVFRFVSTRFPKVKLEERYPLLLIIMFILGSIFLVRNFFGVANYQLYAKVESDISYASVKALAKDIPKNSPVYVNYRKGDTNIEIYLETGWHLSVLYNRGDINFEYLDQNNLCTQKARFIFDRTSDRLVKKDEFLDTKKYIIVENGESLYQPINYGVVLKSFLANKKLESWSDLHKFEWTILLQKANTCIGAESVL